MKRLTLKRIGIGLFCVTLIGGGALSVGLNLKTITKQTLLGIQNSMSQEPGIASAIKGSIAGFESGINSSVYGRESFIDLYGLSARVLGKSYIRDEDPNLSVVKDSNGQLQFICNHVDTMPYVEKLKAVKAAADAKKIPLLYVQTPLKMQNGYSEIPDCIKDYATENTDEFMKELAMAQIPVLDLRHRVVEAGLDQGSLFYNTDHHWRTQTAFWAVGEVVDYLKEKLDISLDENNQYTDLSHYETTVYSQNFLGSQGRRVGRYYGGLDDYTLITPQFDTDYEVTINKSNGSTTAEGSFTETIIKKSYLNAKTVYTNRYAAYFGGDYPEVIIKNKAIDNDMKVLIVKDSFALPFTAYFSTMVGETRMLDTRYYDGEVADYINEYNPDLVLYVYKSINTQK